MARALRQIFSVRVLVVALLLLIWLELGGGEHIAGWYRDAAYAVKNIGKPEELAAPPLPGQHASGLDDAYQAGTDAVLLDMARRQARPPSAPKP